MGRELLTLQDVSKYYTSGQSVVMGLSRVNLTFRAGEFVAITGESGSGKSTLAKILAGILPYESGELLIAGSPTSHYDGSDWEHYRRDSISFISQSYDILPGCSVERNVISALRLTGMDKADAAVRAKEILQEVELWEMRSRRAAKLSSGQKQRLSIARALAKPAPILIADEPTGNLDAENSAKVVQLLAAAAKNRLVIIITHEFDEVADLATRHITMQDSVVSSDIALRPVPQTEQGSTAPHSRKRIAPKGLSLYTAALQVTSRPVWSSIMLTFFALTAFAVFAFLGTFIVNLDDTNTRIYDPSAFRNGDKERIVVVDLSGEQLTDDDLSALLAIPHVVQAERFGYLTDINYFYREGIDYFSHYSSDGGGMDTDATEVSKQVTLEGKTLFMETVPALLDESTFLTAGRLPENMFEVIAGDESLLGKTIPVYICDSKNWGVNAYLQFDLTVVGTTDYGTHLYFDEQIGQAITSAMYHGDILVIPCYTDDLGDTFSCSDLMYRRLLKFYSIHIIKEDDMELFPLPCYGSGEDTIYLSRGFERVFNLTAIIEVSPENFLKMVDQGYGPQMSLTIDNYAYTDEVLDELTRLGYGALSPYQIGSTKQNETLAAERMQTLKVCLLALIAVVLLQIIVLRAMFSMEMEEFRLLANLGLRCKSAKRSVLWQVIAFSLGGEILAVAAIALCNSMKIERIVSILRYLPMPYMLLIWGLHFAAGLLTTAWITSALRRQIYPVSGIRADLNMDEEVEA